MAIVRRNCPHCPAEHVAFEIVWTANPPKGPPHFWNCCAICGACGSPICFVAAAQNPQNRSPPNSIHGDIEPTCIVGHVWPTTAIPTAPPHTPPSVQKRFLEGEDAFRRGRWNSAVAMYRSALDIATKGMEGVPKGQTLFARLEWLHQNHAGYKIMGRPCPGRGQCGVA